MRAPLFTGAKPPISASSHHSSSSLDKTSRRIPDAHFSFRSAGLLGLYLLVDACSTTTTTINKRDLNVQTKMSDTIFLNPLPYGHRDVFVQIRTTSDKADFTIEDQVKAAINKRGNRVVDDANHAQ